MFEEIVILNIRDFDYHCIINGSGWTDAVKLMKNVALTKDREVLWKQKNYNHIKIGKEIIKFGETEIRKQKFHSHKNPISIYHLNIDRIVVSNKVPFGKKWC